MSFWNSGRSLAFSGASALMVSIRTKGLNFSRRSPSLTALIAPVTMSPLRRPHLRTIDSDT